MGIHRGDEFDEIRRITDGGPVDGQPGHADGDFDGAQLAEALEREVEVRPGRLQPGPVHRRQVVGRAGVLGQAEHEVVEGPDVEFDARLAEAAARKAADADARGGTLVGNRLGAATLDRANHFLCH